MKLSARLIAAAAATAFAMPAAAQDMAAGQQPAQGQAAAPVPAAAPDLVIGAPVLGGDGVPLGTIESTDATGAVVTTGDVRGRLNLDAFYKDRRGLMIGYERAEFEQLAAGMGGPGGAEPEAVAETEVAEADQAGEGSAATEASGAAPEE